MQLDIIDQATSPSGPVNEDRLGAAGQLAWVIDGATDIVEAPLAGAHSDADWLAGQLDAALRQIATSPPDNLALLPDLLTGTLKAAFERAARRLPAGRNEHPSATGLIVRAGERGLDYVAIGDCTLLVDAGNAVERVGIDATDAGDQWLATVIGDIQSVDRAATPASTWRRIVSTIGANRALMNTAGGYGCFSITPTPATFIKSGTLDVRPGDTLLLASDGLMRITDVYHNLTVEQVMSRARTGGLASLIGELRAIEAADADCRTYPRAKVRDDATGLLLAVR